MTEHEREYLYLTDVEIPYWFQVIKEAQRQIKVCEYNLNVVKPLKQKTPKFNLDDFLTKLVLRILGKTTRHDRVLWPNGGTLCRK